MGDLIEFKKASRPEDDTASVLMVRRQANSKQGLLPNTLTYLITPSITKTAMLCVLYRIDPSLIYRSTVVVIGIAIFGYTLVLTIITGGPCSPLKQRTLKCLENVALSQAVLNIVSDFAVVSVPIRTIHNLRLTTKQKISVGVILAIGSGYIPPEFDSDSLHFL